VSEAYETIALLAKTLQHTTKGNISLPEKKLD
jgi:hypothetical protein